MRCAAKEWDYMGVAARMREATPVKTMTHHPTSTDKSISFSSGR